MAEELTFEKPQYSEQEQIRRAKLAKYCEEGRDPYTITRFDRTHTSTEILNNFDALEGKTVRIAGRMMSRRIMGKASFVHMMDGDGQIQAYVRREDVEAEPQLEVVAVSDEVGLYIVKSTDSRRFFVFGHPEYDTDTLRLEYERDVKRGLNPEVPAHYFPNDDPTAEPRNVWRSQAQLFYTNWLNYYVYQTTPYDLARAGEER